MVTQGLEQQLGRRGCFGGEKAVQAPHPTPNSELPSFGFHPTLACPRAWEDTKKRVRVVSAPRPAMPSVPIPIPCTPSRAVGKALGPAQHHTWPLQRPSPRGHLLEPQCHSTQLESPGHWEKDLQDILAGDGVWEHPEVPFSLCSITCSSAPHALGRTQLTHPLPPPLWASWLLPNGAN